LHDFHPIQAGNRRAFPLCPPDDRTIDFNGDAVFAYSKELKQFPNIGNRRDLARFAVYFEFHAIRQDIIIRTAFRANQVFRTDLAVLIDGLPL